MNFLKHTFHLEIYFLLCRLVNISFGIFFSQKVIYSLHLVFQRECWLFWKQNGDIMLAIFFTTTDLVNFNDFLINGILHLFAGHFKLFQRFWLLSFDHALPQSFTNFSEKVIHFFFFALQCFISGFCW